MTQAQLVINEILFNPPGPDTNSEYIELRGPPGYVIPGGTYFVSIEGDTNGNPGTVQNLIDLSDRVVGANGFLVFLQKFHLYSPANLATVLTNSDNDPGFGSGSGSSIDHDGEGGQTEMENPSCTFFLVQTTNSPSVGDDIDANNDGAPDGSAYASWTILDSVGVLDNDGVGDIAYGAINFRRDANPGRQAMASGVIVPIPFTAGYIGRDGNTTGSAASAWVASTSLGGSSPDWTLGPVSGATTNTIPVSRTNAPLDHLGAPNFGAPAIPGIYVLPSGGSTSVNEAGGTDSYIIGLTIAPAGQVTVSVTAGPQLQISANGGNTFSTALSLGFNSTAPRTITVRASDDNTVDASPHFSTVLHAVTATGDATRYPLTSFVPDARVGIVENDSLLLSEVKVNPPGADEPFEFVEIRGLPGALLTNVYLLGIDGNASADPGVASLVVDLSGQALGSAGLLLIVGSGHPYTPSPGSTVFTVPQFTNSSGALDNGSLSVLLVSSRSPIDEGEDLDNGDNGVLEGLPGSTTILDAVGWTDGTESDLVFGGVDLTQDDFTPDAAARFPGNNSPLSAAAWFCGDLAGSTGDSVRFSSGNVSSNFPPSTTLTPGLTNNTAPAFSSLPPLSHVIGDPTNPQVNFTITDAETSAASFVATATSDNPSVIPDANLIITSGVGGMRTLTLTPVGVGYADITLTVSDGSMTGRAIMRYAASAMGRPGAIWLTGISDASAAYAIDSNWMITGDDENQIVRLYPRTRSGGPVAQIDLNPFLDLIDLYDDGTPKELDIEGSTHVGSRIYWIGSHSHGLNAAAKTNRSRLFATDIAGSGTNSTLTFTAHYDFLKLDLIEWDANNLHGRGSNYYGLTASAEPGVDAKAPDGSGFNIEGLAMAPGSTSIAYVSFRAPLVSPTNRSKALIVPVNNFAALAANGGGPGSAVFGSPIELNLGCRGIRSIEGGQHGYLIVAGPPGPATGIAPSDFRLFTWNGQPGSPPQERTADLSELNVEAIAELPTGSLTDNAAVQLISDNGTWVYYNDDIQAKQLRVRNFKKFRCDWVSLGPVVQSPPAIRSITFDGTNVMLTWCAVEGASYRVQTKTDLGAPAWTDLPGDVLATDAIAAMSFTVSAAPQRFFQVVRLP